MGLNDPLMD